MILTVGRNNMGQIKQHSATTARDGGSVDYAGAIIDHLDVWTSALAAKSSAGRGSSSKTSHHGIQKLRELILELAVRGKLVPQAPSDEPASVLLEKIAAEKARLVKEKKIKPSKPLSEISEDEKPFVLPQGWELERIGNLFSVVYGKGLSNKELKDEGYKVFGANGVIGFYDSYLYEEEQLLVSCRGAYSGKPNISPPYCYVTSNSLVLENSWKHLNLRFFYYSLTIADKSQIVTGSAQPQVTTTNLEPFIAVVPPLAEQHRIVAKVDELMALCDQLEQRQTTQQQTHQTLVTTLLEAITRPGSDDHNTQAEIEQLFANFDTLFTTEQSIDQLKQTLLQLAVMGKLVPQDPNDQPASQLLQKIASEKARLIKEKKIKKQKPLPDISDDEKPFSMPQGWEWVRFGDLGVIMGGGTPNKANSNYWNGDIPWVSPKDMKVSHIEQTQDNVTQYAVDNSSAKLIPKDSLLIVVRGMILAHSFPVAINVVPVTINQDMKALVILPQIKEYLLLMIQGLKPDFVEMVDRSSHGTCKLVSEKLWAKWVAIPPLAEQHRIVAKVDQLMALCDQLKARLQQAQTTQQHLADAIVEQAVG